MVVGDFTQLFNILIERIDWNHQNATVFIAILLIAISHWCGWRMYHELTWQNNTRAEHWICKSINQLQFLCLNGCWGRASIICFFKSIWEKWEQNTKNPLGKHMYLQQLPSTKVSTLPETNIAPANGWLEDNRFLLGPGLFSGAKVSFRECNHLHSLDFPPTPPKSFFSQYL